MTAQTQNASRRRDGSEGHREILAVAQELFTTIGYRKTTVADIAAELGMRPRERLPLLRQQEVDQ